MSKHRVMLFACLVAAFTAATAAAVNTDGLGPSVDRQSAAGARPEALADGKRLYDANCANCHGARAQGAVKAGFEISIIAERGGKQPPDLTDAAWDHGSTDAEIVTVIKKGVPSGMMAPYEAALSDVEIQNVVAYVRSLSSAQAATTAAAPVGQSPERTLEVVDYVELPVTGDNSTNLVSGQLARGSILRDEPGGQRFFVNDLNGPLYILNKQTKQLTTYLNFDGTADRAGLFPKFTAAGGFASGIMNFVFDPDYARNGIFYTLHMESIAAPGESAMPKSSMNQPVLLTPSSEPKTKRNWTVLHDPAFVPMLRRLTSATNRQGPQDIALRLLYDLAPLEGRQIALRQLETPDSAVSISGVLVLPDSKLPTLEVAFIQSLEQAKTAEEFGRAMDRIERFDAPEDLRQRTDAAAPAREGAS
jgi:mono/diheme cytochrome c family protein